MRRLMLLRHAKTEHHAPSGHDEDRRLDERGRLDAAAIGTWIGQHPPLPDTVLVSTAVRARQTWEIARDANTKVNGTLQTQNRHLATLRQTVRQLYGLLSAASSHYAPLDS